MRQLGGNKGGGRAHLSANTVRSTLSLSLLLSLSLSLCLSLLCTIRDTVYTYYHMPSEDSVSRHSTVYTGACVYARHIR